MSVGKKNRVTGATKMNLHSSRSHAIFSVTIERSERHGDGRLHICVGKLNLVDLAGSERQSYVEDFQSLRELDHTWKIPISKIKIKKIQNPKNKNKIKNKIQKKKK